MAYDLRYEPWIPWRRRSGTIHWGPPAFLLDDLEGDCVVDVAAMRPDFNGALQEFLIGLLTAALLPANDDEWERRDAVPPTADDFRQALDGLPPAFELDGDGPRFLQDLTTSDFDEVRPTPIEQLLIDSPGEQTQRLNKDLFTKRNRVERLGRPAAALALITMQTYAPAGGAGHRTSLRGGGPLTTLIEPRNDLAGRSMAHQRPLWHKLWANVETRESLRQKPSAVPIDALDRAFPWLRATRTSGGGGSSTPPAATHPLEAYFGMPRRIRLEFGDAGRCDLTGAEEERTVVGFRMRNYGVQYVDWQHPLTPHYRQKDTSTEWLPLHGQPGGITWRDWVGLALQGGEGDLRQPAAVVPAYARRVGQRQARTARLHVFGADFDNMKARGWTESTVPLFVVADESKRRLLRETAGQLTDATGMAATALLRAVKMALYPNPDEAPGDIGHARGELWDATEAAFYDVMARLADSDPDAAEGLADELRTGFSSTLRDAALGVFDRWCPTPSLAPEVLRRRVLARHDLSSTLNGYTKLGEKLLAALGAPLPGGGRAVRAARRTASKKASS